MIRLVKGVIKIKNKLVIIVGPTAVGKTDLSLRIAQKFNGEVISGDSMQVYKGLDIGTAKIKPTEMQGIKHHLIDCREANERWSVAEFISEAKQIMTDCWQRGKLPLIVGGTGFYVQALLDGYQLGQDDYEGTEVRAELEEYVKVHGAQALWQQLAAVDAKAAAKIPVNNVRRVIRALEVYRKTGKLFSNQEDEAQNSFEPLVLGLTTERAVLYERINHRVELMLADGLEAEARSLYEHGNLEMPAALGIGYKEFYPYFQGEYSYERAVELIKRNSRRYAKRQLTWFRNKMDVKWFDLIEHPEQEAAIMKLIEGWTRK